MPLFCGEFLGSLAGGVELIVAPMTIAAYAWRQGDLELYLSPLPLIVLASTVFIVPTVSSHFGERPVPEWFLCAICGANLITFAISAFTPLHPAFLLAPRFLSSALAFQVPMINSRLTSLASACGQAKLYALRAASSSMANAVALQLFTSGLFFDPTARGWLATTPFLMSCLV